MVVRPAAVVTEEAGVGHRGVVASGPETLLGVGRTLKPIETTWTVDTAMSFRMKPRKAQFLQKNSKNEMESQSRKMQKNVKGDFRIVGKD